jgi:hypothetical protein
MNVDRIKSLAGQAYVQACLELQQADPAQWCSDRGPPQELVNQKFAELIIRECAQLFEDDGMMSSMAEHVHNNRCKDTILSHFGVQP